MTKSLYIHIPFCRKRCPYCDFYSIVYQKDLASSYIDILCRQIEDLSRDAACRVSTIYIGGGTPTVLEIDLWDKLLKALGKISKKTKEFSLEANPESLDEPRLKLFAGRGINRLSIGVQSLLDEKLKRLGRIHSAQEARDKILLAQKCGFSNLSADFIFGVEEETLASWKKELKMIVELPLKHISAYGLTYEKVASDETSAKIYRYNLDYLPKKGFLQYEVSNFAKKGYPCQHNLNYWENKPCLALGPSAVSYLNGIRSKNVSDLEKYIKKPFLVETKEKLSLLKRAKETAALKIRTNQGVEFNWFKKQTGFNFLEIIGREIGDLGKLGLVRYQKKLSIISLTKKGFLFSDTVSRAFL